MHGKSPLSQRLFSIQNTSDDSMNMIFNNSSLHTREPINNPNRDDTGETDERCAKSTKRSSKTFFKKKDKALKRNITNNDAHGFISSFNQLTSNNLPVITSATTTMLKHVTSNKYERDNHECTVEDSDELLAEQNAIILNKKTAQDEQSKYSKCTIHIGLYEKFVTWHFNG